MRFLTSVSLLSAICCAVACDSAEESLPEAPASPFDGIDHTQLTGLKLVTLGDSQTALCGWQPWLVDWLGIDWSQQETVEGRDGHAATAQGGIWMKPTETNCIYLRGLDAICYDPDIIIIYGGQNDYYYRWLSKSNPYFYQADIAESNLDEAMLYETPYRGDSVNASISTVSAFRGLIEYLLEQRPATRLMLMTHVPIRCEIGMNATADFAAQNYPTPRFASQQDVIDYEMRERYPKDQLIRTMGRYYGLTVIDQWQYSGITFDNAAQYYGDVTGDCTQVHLNTQGDSLLAVCIGKYLTGLLP